MDRTSSSEWLQNHILLNQISWQKKSTHITFLYLKNSLLADQTLKSWLALESFPFALSSNQPIPSVYECCMHNLQRILFKKNTFRV